MNEFHRSLYIYPLIYNAGKAQEQYNVSAMRLRLFSLKTAKKRHGRLSKNLWI